MKFKIATLALLFGLGWMMPSTPAQAEVRSYTIDIKQETINKAGKPVKAMTLNGTIPGPTIKATLGDTLRITFHNKMAVTSSIHWHGVLLPPEQDGVPGLNTRPIAAGESFTFEFPITHSGTYWYHAHTGLQEQRGLYGSLVFNEPVPKYKVDHDLVLVWSDWTNTDPMKILKNLKRDGDYYAREKNSVQSWDQVIKHGKQAIKERLNGAKNRMGPMDLSDIAYDAFLTNGKKVTNLDFIKPGDTVRLRMINAAASSYFNVEFAGGPMTIISADGIDLTPLDVLRFKHPVAETYDVIITMPDQGAFEVRATANDGTGYTSAILGTGPVTHAPDIPRPNLFVTGMDHSMMDMSGDRAMAEIDHSKMDHSKMDMGTKKETPAPVDHSKMDHSKMDMGAKKTTPAPADHSKMDHSQMGKPQINMRGKNLLAEAKKQTPIPYLMDYKPLKALTDTRYPADMPVREIRLEVTGNMERYIWSFNNKTLSESDKIIIKKGERVRFVLVNKTMMEHPLHLHGHFFRVLNGQGANAPVKHTVNLPSMQSQTIEFAANEERDWFFHCHNLYHMKGGMARVVSYKDTTQASRKLVRGLAGDDHFYSFADIQAGSNMTSGQLWTVNNRHRFEAEWEADYDGNYEVGFQAERFITRYLEVFAGVEREKENGLTENTARVGVNYILPFLIESTLDVDHRGHIRFGLSSELQMTKTTKFKWMVNSDEEYRLDLEYEVNKRWSIVATHHDEYKLGIGILAKF